MATGVTTYTPSQTAVGGPYTYYAEARNTTTGCTSASRTAVSLTITKKNLTVSAIGQDKVYNGTTAATVTLTTDKLTNDNVTATYTSATFADKNIGTKTITVSGITISGTDAGNYNLLNTTATTSATITARPLTVTATAQNKVYDGTANASVTLTTDKIGSDIVTPSFTSATFADKNAGTKTVTVSGITISGTDAGNYTLANTNATATTTATITAKPLTITDATATSRVYDGTNVVDVTGSLNGIVSPDNVFLTGKGTLASQNVGTHAVTSIGLTGDDAGNYIVIVPSGLNATISAKALTLSSASAKDKEYDGTANVVITGNLEGIISPDAVTLGSGILASKNVGTHAVTSISLTGAGAGNYTLTIPDGLSATISARTLTVSATGQDKTYDGNATATVTLTTNKISSDDVVATYTSATFADKNVGTGKTVTVTGISFSGTDIGNYNLPDATSLTTTASITKKALTIANASASDKVYDRTNTATVNGTLAGIEGEDVVTLTTSGTFASANAGINIAVTSTSTISGADAVNYTLTQPTGLRATIKPKELTVANARANDKEYDGSRDATITGDLVGVLGNDNVTLTRSGTFASRDVGTHTVTSTSFLDGTAKNNYTLTQPTGLTATITAKALTIANAAANSKVYDGNDAATITGTLSGVISNDIGNVTFTRTGIFATKNVGTNIAVTSTSTLSGTAAGNYTLIQPTGLRANITARALTLSNIAANDKVYDGNRNATIDGTLNGIISGDVVTWNGLGTFASEDVNRQNGTRTVLPISVTYNGSALAGANAGNYTFTLPSPMPALSAKITPKTLTPVIATSYTKEYDGTTTFLVTSGGLQGIVPPDHVELYINGASNAGVYENATLTLSIGATDKDNYELAFTTATSKITITPKALSINPATANKVYDGTTSATVSLTGVIGSDNVTLKGTYNFTDKNVGTNKIINFSQTGLDGTAAANYTLNQPTELRASITPKSIVGEFRAENKKYDGTTDATITPNSRAVIGKIDGDDLTLTGVTATFDNPNPGTNKKVTLRDASLAGTDRNNYLLPVLPFTFANIDEQPLPVSLTSFTAKAQKEGVQLNWTTAAEKDNDYFQIERSMDGRNFSAIGQVKGNGNSNVRVEYSFLDGKAPVGTAYYRLKQVDYDGKFEYSKTVAVQTKASSAAQVTVNAYPNPTPDEVNLDLTQVTSSEVKVAVFALNGRLVKTLTLTGGKLQRLDLTDVAVGTYLVKVAGDNIETVIRVVRQ